MKIITLLALACLPHITHAAEEGGDMEHKSLPREPNIYPQKELERRLNKLKQILNPQINF